jgi:RNA polymerase sigma-70 factor (ECF subfamily)
VTDEELVARARTGDTDAFDQLVARHQAAAYRAALAALCNPADAEEAAQDGLVRAWSNLGRFRGDSSFRTWLLTIVWNCALSRRRAVMQWLRRKAPVEEAVTLPEGAGSPYRETRDREMRTHVASAIEMLTPKLRDALLLAQSGDYDYTEIARMLKIPVGTLKWRVSEARRQVMSRLQVLGYVERS